jgi:hypothetical protein
MSGINKFSNFADATPILDGKKAGLEEVFGKEIIVLNYRVQKTKYADAKNPDCLTVQFEFANTPGEHRVFFSGSGVLRDQLKQYQDKLPFMSVVRRVGKYFSFT